MKELFRQNTVYNFFRLKKKHLVLIRKIHFIKQKLFKLRTFHLIKTIYLE